jgi:hypothetical protein
MNAKKVHQYQSEPFNEFLKRAKLEVIKCQVTQEQLNELLIDIVSNNCISSRFKEQIILVDNVNSVHNFYNFKDETMTSFPILKFSFLLFLCLN